MDTQNTNIWKEIHLKNKTSFSVSISNVGIHPPTHHFPRILQGFPPWKTKAPAPPTMVPSSASLSQPSSVLFLPNVAPRFFRKKRCHWHNENCRWWRHVWYLRLLCGYLRIIAGLNFSDIALHHHRHTAMQRLQKLLLHGYSLQKKTLHHQLEPVSYLTLQRRKFQQQKKTHQQWEDSSQVQLDPFWCF